ncbi:dihydrodipicolinate synthetase [Planctomycetota bacterium]|nr:dihydrodipicolinate synthetase [Planctomycetota bacterium]
MQPAPPPAAALLDLLRAGTVIPAVPLALDARRRFDERRQRALIRYYLEAGAGGIAVGMHFTQFEIRLPGIDLFEPVLALCREEAAVYMQRTGRRVATIAGIDGATESALAQAATARRLGYDIGIVSLRAFTGAHERSLLAHMARLAEVIPLFGFYLLTGVGGIRLPYAFWRDLVEQPWLHGIKIAPFDRYGTNEVMRAVAEAGRQDDLALYTGNDESIVHDLITPFTYRVGGRDVVVRMRGGLLGQWACWTRRAVELLDRLHAVAEGQAPVDAALLALAAQITDANSALFDPAHGFAGSIPGVNEVLRRQGLLAGTWTLRRDEVLSPGQSEEIDRVIAAYPHLTDDEFVAANRDRWLGGRC